MRPVIAGVLFRVAICLVSLALWMKYEPKYQIMHRPKAGCPVNYEEVSDFFTEKDGSKEPACLAIRDYEPGTIDMVKAGESLVVTMDIPIKRREK